MRTETAANDDVPLKTRTHLLMNKRKRRRKQQKNKLCSKRNSDSLPRAFPDLCRKKNLQNRLREITGNLWLLIIIIIIIIMILIIVSIRLHHCWYTSVHCISFFRNNMLFQFMAFSSIIFPSTPICHHLAVTTYTLVFSYLVNLIFFFPFHPLTLCGRL